MLIQSGAGDETVARSVCVHSLFQLPQKQEAGSNVNIMRKKCFVGGKQKTNSREQKATFFDVAAFSPTREYLTM